MDGIEEAVQTFEANNFAMSTNAWIALAFAIAGIIGTAYFLKLSTGKNRNLYIVGAMLSFFVFTIAGGTSFFSWLTTRKISDVIISSNQVVTGYGTTTIDNISRIYFHKEVEQSVLSPTLEKQNSRFLIIEEIGGKTHALAAENYDIGKIYGLLKKKTGKDKKED